MEQVVAVQVAAERVDHRQAGGRSVGHRDGDGPVQLDHGDGCSRASSAYHEAIRGQSVSSGRGARSWSAAISAWTRYGPPGPSAGPDPGARVPRRSRRGPNGHGPGPPAARGPRRHRSGPTAGRSAGPSARAARTSGLSGSRRDDAGEPDRLVAELLADQLALRRGVSLVEDQIEDRLHAGEPLGRSSAGGTR